jgi:Protein of unknown function (DUF2726)
VNRKTCLEPLLSEALPEAPWPVAARNLLTNREQLFYQRLLSVYPNHRIFVQVALSQLIDVDRNHPERESIRARYKQLVADFVLCRSDLGVIAVIELDDRSHERWDRQTADARKARALGDAGLRLVRVPAGALPSETRLREIIDADRPAADRSDTPSLHFVPAESDFRLAADWGGVQAYTPRLDHNRGESRAMQAIALKMVLGGVVIVGGWFVYSQLMPAVVQGALQPLAVRHVPSSSTPPQSAVTFPPTWITPVPQVAGPTQEELAEKRRAESQRAADLQRQKDHAWLAYYSAPSSCEHPVDWKAQVECGNQYMRAKKEFAKQWLAEHGTDQATGLAIVLENGSIGEARK